MAKRPERHLPGPKAGSNRLNILLLGKTGQVGFELHRGLSPLGPITAPGRSELDLMNGQAVTEYLEHHQPDLIINAAA